jgi:Mrp family chromosome partitioning ATPase
MREVDEALARAYSQRDQADPPQGVPPAPHLIAFDRPVRIDAPAHVPSRPPSSGARVELQWPAPVLGLERDWGERFERMAHIVLEALSRQNRKVILFTSCHRAEGRTTLVLTLARVLGRHTLRTLIVDADLTGPMVARLLGLRPGVGLDDVVDQGLTIADALIDAPDENLVLLPMRSAVARPRDFLASPAWTCALAWLRREFDLILVDGGPLFTGLSAAVLHRSVDAAVLVHHRGMTGERAVLRAREVLEAGGVPLLGLAATFV